MPRVPNQMWPWLAVLFLGLVLIALPTSSLKILRTFPADFTIPLSEWINLVTDWALPYIKPGFRLISAGFGWSIDVLKIVLVWLPWPITLLFLLALSWHLSGLALSAFTLITTLYIVSASYWTAAMNTLSLVIFAVIFSIALGLVLGIVTNRSKVGGRIIPPLLDLMQTIPAFAYLPILLVLFGFGPVVGVVASIIYAAPPMVRNVALGLNGVAPNIREASTMSGTSLFQTLVWVELPSAIAQIRIGINQTILAAFSMVIIASVIGGSDDIGWEVLNSIRKARFGESLMSGGAIVFMAIIMDRMSTGNKTRPILWIRHVLPFAAFLTLITLALKYFGITFPIDLLTSRDWAKSMNDGLDAYVATHGQALTDFKNTVFYFYLLPLRNGLINTIFPFTWGFEFTAHMKWSYGICTGLIAIVCVAFQRWRLGLIIAFTAYILYLGFTGAPWFVLFAISTLIAWQIGRLKLMLFVAIALAFILVCDMWPRAMLSVYLCGAAALVAFTIGGFLGICAANSKLVSSALRPVSDMFQTIPMFVFLIPALMFFQIGEFTALLAIIAYAFVPAIRYVEAGLRQVPEDLLEVAKEQGCTPWQTFWQVKLPLALPSIMVGLNQTVLFSFAMLAITALVGTTGLGEQVYTAVRGADVGLGVVAGLSMALLAMIVDRCIQSSVATPDV